MKKNAAVFAGLLLLVALVYGMTIKAPVIHDDQIYIGANPVFLLPPGRFAGELLGRDYFAATGEATYQPGVTALHYLTWENPPVYRAWSLLAHALNAFLVFLLAERIGGRGPAAFLAAVLFALFPASTEAVNISSYKGHVLGLSFLLLSLLSWDRVLAGGARARRWAAACAGCFAVGLFFKETVLLAPLFLEAYRRWGARAPWRREAGLTAAGIAAAGAAYCLWRFGILEPPAIPLRSWHAPFSFLGWYVRMLAWPQPLCLQRGLSPGWPWRAWAAAFLAAGWLLRKRRELLFSWIWIAVALLPYLRLVPFATGNPVADRYLYWPAAGLSLLLSSGLGRGAARMALLVIVLAWGAAAIGRNGLYRDRAGIAEQTASCAPENPAALVMLGNARLSEGRNAEAKAVFAQAVRLEPAGLTQLNDLAIAECELGENEAGIADFRRALAVQDGAMVRNNLGKALVRAKRYGEAIEEFAHAQEKSPGWAEPARNAEATRRLMRAP